MYYQFWDVDIKIKYFKDIVVMCMLYEFWKFYRNTEEAYQFSVIGINRGVCLWK